MLRVLRGWLMFKFPVVGFQKNDSMQEDLFQCDTLGHLELKREHRVNKKERPFVRTKMEK